MRAFPTVALGSPRRVARLKRHFEIYQDRLSSLSEIRLPGFDLAIGEVPQWVDAVTPERDGLEKHLADRGMQCRRFWFPIHEHQPSAAPADHYPNSAQLMPQAMWLPSAYTLQDEDIEAVCQAVHEYFGRK